MQEQTKIQLSQPEQQLMLNAEWILTKNSVMDKMNRLLQECQEGQLELFKKYAGLLPHDVFITAPKISRGENYLGLPWLMLDHPRYFKKEDVFALRIFFWWGNFFSITLQLSGIYKNSFSQKIKTAYPALSNHNIHVGVSTDEWIHHFGTDNYKRIAAMNPGEFERYIDEKKFIKLAYKTELTDWEVLPAKCCAISKLFCETLV
jgi:hypothetical protein